MEAILQEYEKNILKEINKQDYISHNHPPVKHVVDGCLYCKLYGNILIEPHITISKDDVRKYLKTNTL